MKKNYLVILLFLVCGLSYGQQNVGIGIINPDASALLDLTSTSKGFLVPRMNAVSRLAIATPATGLIVFDTDTGCTFFYTGLAWKNMCVSGGGYNDSLYFNPTGTVSVVDGGGTKTSPLGAWLITGNSGTTAGTNFAGTTDAQDFVLKSNSTEVMRVTTAGAVGVNQPTPNNNAILDVNSNSKGVLVPSLTTTQRDAIVLPIAGLTIYNNTLNVHQFWNGTCWVNVGQTVCSFDYTMNYLTPSDTSSCLLGSNFSTVSDTIQLNLISGTPSPVILTAVGVPAGVMVSFSNNYLIPPQSSIMTFTALSALSGTYQIKILATSGSTVQVLNYTLNVFGFNLTLTPPDTTVSLGNLSNGGYISQTTISIGNPGACASGNLTAILSAQNLPNGVTASFGTTSLAIPGATTMTLISNCPLPGTYPINIQAQIGIQSSYSTYTLTITPPQPVTISASTNNLDLSTLFGTCPGNDTVIINAGVNICSTDPTKPALTSGTLPTGGTLTIINKGSIIGAGGAGGGDPANAGQTPCPTADGQAGGDAILIASGITTNIINTGTIAGGGGGGGAGQALTGTNLAALCNFSFNNQFYGGAGGGGAGCTPGAAGTDVSCNSANAQPGTANAGGAGGPAPTSGCTGCQVSVFGQIIFSSNAGTGGSGGGLGAAGQNGNTYNTPGGVNISTSCPQGQGGAAGYSVRGNACGCYTVTGAGSVLGPKN